MGGETSQVSGWPGPDAIWFQTEDLFSFVQELQRAGYNIGVGEYLAACDLVLALLGRGVDLSKPDSLKTFLGPLLVSTRIEQEDFARRYDAWASRVAARKWEMGPRQAKEPAPRIRRWFNQTNAVRIVLGVIAGLVMSIASYLIVSLLPASTASPTQATATPLSTKLLNSINSILGGMALLIVLIALFPVVRRWWQQNQFLARHTTPEPPSLTRISVEATAGQALFPDIEYLRLAQGLRHRVEVPSRELDVPRTLRQTLKKGGWFTPVYGMRRVMPEYLVLVDQASREDHQARFVREMVRHLRQQEASTNELSPHTHQTQVYISGYYFDRDPRLCFPMEGGPPKTLWEIITQGSQQRLILFSDAEGLFDPLSGELQPWNELFLRVEQRAVLTPAPVEHWGYYEEQLGARYQVLPLSAKGLEQFVQALDGAEVSVPIPGRMSPRIPKELVESPKFWCSRQAPEPADIERMLSRLRRYLGDEGFLWLSACAVYPELRWEITLHLGEALEGGSGLNNNGGTMHLLTPRKVLDLARLPWFRAGSLPNWLRLRLIGGLSRAQEAQIRAILFQVLASISDEKTAGLYLEIAGHPQQARSILSKLAAQPTPDKPLQDVVCRTFLFGGNPGRLAVRMPEAVRRILDRRPVARARQSPQAGLFSGPNLLVMGSWIAWSIVGAFPGILLGITFVSQLASQIQQNQAAQIILVCAISGAAVFQANRVNLPISISQINLGKILISVKSSFLLENKGAFTGITVVWLIASLAGAITGYSLAEIAGSFALQMAAFGLAIGLFQWLALVRLSRRAWAWLPTTLAAWLALGLAGQLIFGFSSAFTQPFLVVIAYLITNLLTAPLAVWVNQTECLRSPAPWGQPFERWKITQPKWPATAVLFFVIWVMVSGFSEVLYVAVSSGSVQSIAGASSSPTVFLGIFSTVVFGLFEWLILARFTGVGIDWVWAGLGAIGAWWFVGTLGLSSNINIVSVFLVYALQGLLQAPVLRKVNQSLKVWVWPLIMMIALLVNLVTDLLTSSTFAIWKFNSSFVQTASSYLGYFLNSALLAAGLVWILKPVFQAGSRSKEPMFQTESKLEASTAEKTTAAFVPSLADFAPSRHGFKFLNYFRGYMLPFNIPLLQSSQVPAVYGLCGGMAAAAADFFLAGRAVPRAAVAPQNGTVLQRYLFRRSLDMLAMGETVLQIARWMALPEDGPNGTYALTLNEFQKIRDLLDNGQPVPLCLLYQKGKTAQEITQNIWNNHHVLAYRYLESQDGSVLLSIYDPNEPGNDGVILIATRVQVGMEKDGPVYGFSTVEKGKRVTVPSDPPVYGFFRLPYKAVEPPEEL